MTLFAKLVEAKKLELSRSMMLEHFRAHLLQTGTKQDRKVFEDGLRALSKATREVNKAESAIVRSALSEARNQLGLDEIIEESETEE